MHATSSLTVGLASTVYVLAWIPIAWGAGVLTPRQMLRKYPEHRQVIPLVVDSYVWADLFLLSPLLGFVAGTIEGKWSDQAWLFALVAGTAQALTFQFAIVAPGKYPSTLGGAGKSTVLGVLHIPYMAFALALIELFVFTSVSVADTAVVACGLMLLIPADILVPLHFFGKWSRCAWVPPVFEEERRLFWMIGGAWSTIVLAAALKALYV